MTAPDPRDPPPPDVATLYTRMILAALVLTGALVFIFLAHLGDRF